MNPEAMAVRKIVSLNSANGKWQLLLECGHTLTCFGGSAPSIKFAWCKYCPRQSK